MEIIYAIDVRNYLKKVFLNVTYAERFLPIISPTRNVQKFLR
ncbi:MAG TPA: hypothetical protein PLN39_01925 [Candidatus Dojkabacteria bacterium]|nr:hypothetical protein [Candidatus Dojkabacteria bacterium]